MDERNSVGVTPSGSGCSAEPGPSSTVPAVPVSIPNALGPRRGFQLISEHIEYLERENGRLNELLATYLVNALRGEKMLAEFICGHGRDVHRGRKTLAAAIDEFQASAIEGRRRKAAPSQTRARSMASVMPTTARRTTESRVLMDEVKLLPCPFCGNHGAIYQDDGDYYVSCTVCWSQSPLKEHKAEAIAAWNHRPTTVVTGEHQSMTQQSSDMVKRAITIVENGEVDISTGIGTFSANERDTILRALDAPRHAEVVAENSRLLWLIANLEPLCVNPGDGAPFEDGEVPYIDEARTIIRLNEGALLREAGVRFLDDMAAKIGAQS